MRFTIRTPATERDLDDVRALFREYAASPDWEPGFASYLDQQGFEREVAELPRVYAAPAARVLLAATEDGTPAGCVAFKPLEPGVVCEMKRLYVRPAHRGHALGRRLVERLLEDAAAAGYARIRLDTLPSMARAQRLYEELGFHAIPPYCANPVAGSVFLEKELHAAGPARTA